MKTVKIFLKIIKLQFVRSDKPNKGIIMAKVAFFVLSILFLEISKLSTDNFESFFEAN